MSEINLGIVKVGGVVLAGATVGVLGTYFAEKTVKDAIANQPWVLPVLGGLAGAAAGGIFSGKILDLFP